MTKRLLLMGLLLTLIIALNGCYSDDPQPKEKATEVTNSSFSESEESTASETATDVATEETDTTTQEETEYSKDIAEMDTTTVSATKETPKSNDIEKNDEPDKATQSVKQSVSEVQTSESQTVTQETNAEMTELETVVATVSNATKNDCRAIAQKVLEYINAYRSVPATKLSGLTEYAEYRSRQLVSNFAHSTDDERTAATALCYGEYVDPTLYGMTGEPYYTAGAREAIVKTGYVGSIDKVAEKIALLVKNSSGHWCYVGSSDYSYIAVGVTYESGVWYCDIAMTTENTDNK